MTPLVEFAGVAFGYPRPARSREGGLQPDRRVVRHRARRDLRRDRPEQRGQDHAAPAAHARGRRRLRGEIRLDGRPLARAGPRRAGPAGGSGAAGRAAPVSLHGRAARADGPLSRTVPGASSRATGTVRVAREPWPPPACSTSPTLPLEQLRGRRAPASDAGPRARPAAAAAGARRADLAPRPALPGCETAALLRRVNARARHDGAARLPRSRIWPPRCATACCCSTAGRVARVGSAGDGAAARRCWSACSAVRSRSM